MPPNTNKEHDATPAEVVPELSRPVAFADAETFYRLALGRDAESHDAIQSHVDMTRGQLIRQFFSSSEFDERVIRPVMQLRQPQGQIFDRAPGKDLLDWAARFLPLTESGRNKLVRAPTWVSAYDTIFSDLEFCRALPQLKELCSPGMFHKRLDELSSRMDVAAPIGDVEEASGLSIRGWAVDKTNHNRPIGVELWVDGVFVAATLAHEFRRDLQDRFGSDGEHGFTFEGFSPLEAENQRPIRVEVRESASKLSIGSRTVIWRPDQEATRYAELSNQIFRVREVLESVEASLSHISANFGFMLANYDQYRRSFYVDTPASVLSNSTEAAAFSWEPSFTILIPANPLLASDLIETLASLRRQIYRSFSVLVVTPSSPLDGAIETQLVNAAGLKAAVELQGDYALVLDSGDSLSPDALHRFASVLQNRKPALLYGDNDELEIRASGVSRHINPHFKPDFDPDLLLQSPFIGDSFVAPIASLRRALQSGFDLSRESRGALVLELAGPMAGADAEHVQRILHNRSAAAPKVEPSVYASAVRAYLSRARSDVEVIMPQVEAADFKSPRILWPIPKETRAAVIIPTRDRLDLLGPCLASLIAAKARAKVPLEIVVVDNASTSVTTERFLDALDLTGTIKLIEYDAPFNWSAINNHAARSVHADVLIFLNNDTVALSQDWSDELCRQAIRPEIGAVGPRLLYEDGTIQHAGIILSDGRIVHEGAGSRADDGGYLDRRHQVHRTAAVTGACLATRAEIFNKLGGFDEEELAVEANDIDYCLRVRRAGLGVVYDPFCTLYHFESQSRGHTAGKESTRAQAKAELTNLKRRWGSDLGGDRFYNLHFDRRSAPFTRLGPPPTLAKPSNIE